MPMMESRKEADSLSAPNCSALAAKNMNGTKKPRKVMKLEKQSRSNVADLKRENWIREDRVRMQADDSFRLSASSTASGIF